MKGKLCNPYTVRKKNNNLFNNICIVTSQKETEDRKFLSAEIN